MYFQSKQQKHSQTLCTGLTGWDGETINLNVFIKHAAAEIKLQ